MLRILTSQNLATDPTVLKSLMKPWRVASAARVGARAMGDQQDWGNTRRSPDLRRAAKCFIHRVRAIKRERNWRFAADQMATTKQVRHRSLIFDCPKHWAARRGVPGLMPARFRLKVATSSVERISRWRIGILDSSRGNKHLQLWDGGVYDNPGSNRSQTGEVCERARINLIVCDASPTAVQSDEST